MGKINMLALFNIIIISLGYKLLNQLKYYVIGFTMLQHIKLMQFLLYYVVGHSLHVPSDHIQ